MCIRDRLLDTAFTVVNVPYTALTPELTRDYDERTSLNSFRFAFSIGSGLIAAVLHPLIVNAVQPSMGIQGAYACLLYTSPSPRDRTRSRMPSSA